MARSSNRGSPSPIRPLSWLLAGWLLTLAAWPLLAAEPSIPPRPGQAMLIPETFLRAWDPVTLFFDQPAGPAQGGAEDHPERLVQLSPPHPGEFRWLDARTLQFRPTTPWPPLQTFRWTQGVRTTTLATLMAPPRNTQPTHGATQLPPFDTVTLQFDHPLPALMLPRILTIRLSPLEHDRGPVRELSDTEYQIKEEERVNLNDPAIYLVRFKEPIPAGTRMEMAFRLALEDREEAFHRLRFSTTMPEFRLLQVGCDRQLLPISTAGIRYAPDQALTCTERPSRLQILFSSPPLGLTAMAARNLVRLSPPLNRSEIEVADRTLTIKGDFTPETLYEINFAPTDLQDQGGHPLHLGQPSRVYVRFPEKQPFLKWQRGDGVVERFGPRQIPLEGGGFRRVDVRIHAIDPLDRRFWPFPEKPLKVDENAPPAGPGEEPTPPGPERDVGDFIDQRSLHNHLKQLGSPVVSELVPLPLGEGAASLGLDLAPLLARIKGANAPGSYLVGLRPLDHDHHRVWMRLQVTNLSLSVVEEEGAVRFLVTALNTAQPVVGATVRVEGYRKGALQTLFEGQANPRGEVVWEVSGEHAKDKDAPRPTRIRRLVVIQGEDHLVLYPQRDLLQQYTDNHWRPERELLAWTVRDPQLHQEPGEDRCHIHPDRPVHRPDEVVHLAGYVRRYDHGRFAIPEASRKMAVVIKGPGKQGFRLPLQLSPLGGFHIPFKEENRPTGDYSAHVELDGQPCGLTQFKLEYYVLPKFQVELSAPSRVALDQPFTVQLAARYYAGGALNRRPVRWRITQFPYHWQIKGQEGYLFATDARYSGEREFLSTPAKTVEAETDGNGTAFLRLDPSQEPTAQPRRYVIESTVTGDDDRTVTTTREVVAVPPFAMGIQTARYLGKDQSAITGRVLVLGPEGNPLADQEILLRLIKRRWLSTLQAGDYSQGVARYQTEQVDEPLQELPMQSGEKPLEFSLPCPESGVYVVRLEARDRLGRTQQLGVELFKDGETSPITWSAPNQQGTFKVTPDQTEYLPGATARLVLESPFQQAHALAVVEQADGRHGYHWVAVNHGAATFSLPILKGHAPRLPVHFLLMHGRQTMTLPPAGSGVDPDRPATLAATTWLTVKPSGNQVKVDLSYPEKAMPGEEMVIVARLADEERRPLSGEITLWMVDQAVLALGREQRLDPLPDFIRPRPSTLAMRDGRNMAFGFVPFRESPGGGVPQENSDSLLDRVTIRKNFQPVPLFAANLAVGPSGEIRVPVTLPDMLTNFKLRAKAVSGTDRFGYATGMVRVRLPVIVQPSLPRFVRPGDRFLATATGRIVEGEAGPGEAVIRTTGLQLTDMARQGFEWSKEQVTRLAFPVTLPAGGTAPAEVKITLGVERKADQARDAFEVTLPVQPDREEVTLRRLVTLEPARPFTVPEVTEPLLPATFRRQLTLSTRPEVLHLLASRDALRSYPHGCVEQRLSRAMGLVATRGLATLLGESTPAPVDERAIRDTLALLPQATDRQGRVAFWPGQPGQVFLTAWASILLSEAREAGIQVDRGLLERYSNTLKRALRTDTELSVSGEAFAERSWALLALGAAGQLDEGYAAELLRQAQFLDLEGAAMVLAAVAGSKTIAPESWRELLEQTRRGLVWQRREGRTVYAGLQHPLRSSPLILPSEERTLAAVLRAWTLAAVDTEESDRLASALMEKADRGTWSDTSADAMAVLALRDRLRVARPLTTAPVVQVSAGGSPERPLVLDAGHPWRRESFTDNAPLGLRLEKSAGSVGAEVLTRYLPADAGGDLAAVNRGFVVRRELIRVASDGSAPERFPLDVPGRTLAFKPGEIIEEHLEVVSPEERHHVAVVIPLAAGIEPLNPNLGGAPPEAKPLGRLTTVPTYTLMADDRAAFYYDRLSSGTHHFYLRTRVATPGHFVQPPAFAERMYDRSVQGRGNGGWIEVQPGP